MRETVLLDATLAAALVHVEGALGGAEGMPPAPAAPAAVLTVSDE